MCAKKCRKYVKRSCKQNTMYSFGNVFLKRPSFLSYLCMQKSILFLCRSELEVRLEHAQKDFAQMDERIKFLRAEKSEQFAIADGLQVELGKCHFPEIGTREYSA